MQRAQAIEVEDGVEGGGVAVEVILWRVAGRVAVTEGEDRLDVRAGADQAGEARRRQHREVFPHHPSARTRREEGGREGGRGSKRRFFN